MAPEVRGRHGAFRGGQLLDEFHFNKCWATFGNSDNIAFCLMGAALRPLEQENDLKEGLINTSSMIQGARDRMLKCGGEHSTGIMWKWVRRRREQAGEGGNWCSNFCNKGLKCRLWSSLLIHLLVIEIGWQHPIKYKAKSISWSSKIRAHQWQQNVAESKQNRQFLQDLLHYQYYSVWYCGFFWHK